MSLRTNNSYFQVGNHTDVGLQRQINEDYFSFFECQNGAVFIVCDGMGGHQGGDVASHSAVETLRNFLENKYYADPSVALKEGLQYTNLHLFNLGTERNLKNMGTTVVIAIVREQTLWYAHVGDSRIYYYNSQNANFQAITKDHSWVQYLVDKGEITQAEAENHPDKHKLTRALGVRATMVVDVAVQPLQVADGDKFLLCTDGLTNMVPVTQLQEVLISNKHPQDKALNLVEMANFGGGTDNITVQIIEFIPESSATIATSQESIPVASATPNFTPHLNPSLEKTLPGIPTEEDTDLPPPPPVGKATHQTEPTPFINKRNKNLLPIIIGAIALVILFCILLAVKSCKNEVPVGAEHTNDTTATNKPTDTIPKPPLDTALPTINGAEQFKNRGTDLERTIGVPSSFRGENENVFMPPADTTKKVATYKGTSTEYTIKDGDALASIAKRFNLTEEILKKDNGLTDIKIKQGKKLKVRVQASHKLKSGETLNVLAKKYGVTTEQIKKANKIEDETSIKENTIIQIPVSVKK